MNQEKIDRINVLARKSKEQDLLRKEYIANIRRNLRAQLDNIDLVAPDGTTENLGEKFGKGEAN